MAETAPSGAGPDFLTICERAMLSPDTTKSPAEIAARYARMYGEPISAEQVVAAEAAWHEERHQAPVIASYKIKGFRL